MGCIRIDGGTPAASRQALVTDFQEKDATRAAVVCQFASFVSIDCYMFCLINLLFTWNSSVKPVIRI